MKAYPNIDFLDGIFTSQIQLTATQVLVMLI